MNEIDHRFRLPIYRAGCIAFECLKKPRKGQVSAVFDTSFYVEFGTDSLCIGNSAMDDGPLNLITAAPPSTIWPASGVQVGAVVYARPEKLHIGDQFIFDLTDTKSWHPESTPPHWTPFTLTQGVNSFRKMSIDRAPRDGLSSFMYPASMPRRNCRVASAAAASVRQLSQWMTKVFIAAPSEDAQDFQFIGNLIGLGPGLTPSGDDLIGGIMIALHTLGSHEAAQELSIAAHRYALNCSNSISAAHLSAAGYGLGSAAIHDCLATIMAGKTSNIERVIGTIDNIGHTSGWDIMAGCLIAADAWLENYYHDDLTANTDNRRDVATA